MWQNERNFSAIPSSEDSDLGYSSNSPTSPSSSSVNSVDSLNTIDINEYTDANKYAIAMTKQTEINTRFIPFVVQVLQDFLSSSVLRSIQTQGVVPFSGDADSATAEIIALNGITDFQQIYKLILGLLNSKLNFDPAVQAPIDQKIEHFIKRIDKAYNHGYILPADYEKILLLINLNNVINDISNLKNLLITGFCEKFHDELQAKKAQINQQFETKLCMYGGRMRMRSTYNTHVRQNKIQHLNKIIDRLNNTIADANHANQYNTDAYEATYKEEFSNALAVIQMCSNALQSFYQEHSQETAKLENLNFKRATLVSDQKDGKKILNDRKDVLAANKAVLDAQAILDSYKNKNILLNYSAVKRAKTQLTKAQNMLKNLLGEEYRLVENLVDVENAIKKIEQEITTAKSTIAEYDSVITAQEQKLTTLQNDYREMRDHWEKEHAGDQSIDTKQFDIELQAQEKILHTLVAQNKISAKKQKVITKKTKQLNAERKAELNNINSVPADGTIRGALRDLLQKQIQAIYKTLDRSHKTLERDYWSSMREDTAIPQDPAASKLHVMMNQLKLYLYNKCQFLASK